MIFFQNIWVALGFLSAFSMSVKEVLPSIMTEVSDFSHLILNRLIGYRLYRTDYYRCIQYVCPIVRVCYYVGQRIADAVIAVLHFTGYAFRGRP